MDKQEIKTIIARIQQAREAQNEYDFIDRDFLSADDMYYIFEHYYLPWLDPKKIEKRINHMLEALYTWQFITDFTYPTMNCRKKKGESHLDHLNRRLKMPLPDMTFKVENMFTMGDKTFPLLRRKFAGHLA